MNHQQNDPAADNLARQLYGQEGQAQNSQPGQGAGPQVNGQFVASSPSPRKYSALSIFLAIIFFVVLVLFGERLIFDLNRFLNPVVDKDYTNAQLERSYQSRRSYDADSPSMKVRDEMLFESSGLAKARIYYPSSEKGRYLIWKLMIHALVIVPVFLSAFLFSHKKGGDLRLKPLLTSYMVFGFWMVFHLLGETVSVVKYHYPNFAIYIILGCLVVLFGFLAYYTQSRFGKRSEQ